METTEIDGEKYVLATDLAASLGVERMTIHAAIRDERLTGVKRFGRMFVPLAQAEAFQVKPRGGAREGAGRKRKAEA